MMKTKVAEVIQTMYHRVCIGKVAEQMPFCMARLHDALFATSAGSMRTANCDSESPMTCGKGVG